jgi:diguanylate cyclase (GGDEF)-like protein/PAS domain S-box-containing protein
VRRSWRGHWLSSWFNAYEAAEPTAGTFRARQLQAVLRLTPVSMTANLLNVALVVTTFWPIGHHLFLACWGLGIGTLVVLGLRAWRRWRGRSAWTTASRRALRRSTLQAALLAAFWGTMPLVLFPGADGERQVLVATITTGMICAGGFALATTPAAGTAYVLILGTGAAVALLRADMGLALPIGLLLLIYSLIVVASVWATARLFGARLMAEAEAERQNEVIGLLLRDFEEHASDVLWEIDADGRLLHVSPRLAALFGLPAAQLGSRPVVERLQEMKPDDPAVAGQLSALRQHLARGTPFRDLKLAATRGGRTRWWSLSAKPLVDDDGACIGWRGVASDITEAQQANRQLTWLAHYDALTGLANRHQLRSRLAELLQPPGRAAQAFAVLCLDLDHFKTINDTLGHAVGDGLLQEVAQRLSAATRRSDTVARLGGDEFAVVLHGVGSVDEVQLLTQRLLDGLMAPCQVLGASVAVRTSIGIAMAPQDGNDIDQLLNNADLALYAAKSAGRGEFRFFAPQMAALTRRRLVIEQALRDALARGELSLAFQPQVDLASSRVTGFEALLRWQHAELGDVAPAEFIPVAEEAGLIGAIGRWVLNEACRQAAGWPAPLTVAVNVSPVQAMSQDLCRLAQEALKASELAAGRLELEITESVFLNETQATMRVLHALRQAGLRVALDDFGTGYSSLAYLRRFPFDTLKIDRSFVRELMQRRDARAIVKMIVGLAQTLNMKTLAEGVEEPAQAAALREHGCSAIQGFLVARPMSAAEVPAFLAAWERQGPLALPDHLPTAPMPLGATG